MDFKSIIDAGIAYFSIRFIGYTIIILIFIFLAIVGLITVIKWIIQKIGGGRRSTKNSYSDWEKKRRREIRKNKGSHL